MIRLSTHSRPDVRWSPGQLFISYLAAFICAEKVIFPGHSSQEKTLSLPMHLNLLGAWRKEGNMYRPIFQWHTDRIIESALLKEVERKDRRSLGLERGSCAVGAATLKV